MTQSLRRGFALLELLIAITIAAIIGGAITTAVTYQSRFATFLTERLALQERIRDATSILTADLRSVSSIPNGIISASDTAIEFFSVVGASILCQAPLGNQLALPPDSLPNDKLLTSWIVPPDSNDIVVIYQDSNSLSPTRGWLRLPIAKVSSPPVMSTCPPSTGMITATDAIARTRGYTIILSAPPPLSIAQGTPIRFLRRARYSIYRASDSHWYLGFRRCHASSGLCEVIQPISGPYSKERTPPLSFRYYSTTGLISSPDASGGDITRLDIIIRGYSNRLLHLKGISSPKDSAVATITFRNHL